MNLSAHLLTKRYGASPEYEAVRNASLELPAGEFVSIVGRSGSGKSTLLAMLGALTPPTTGKILLDGTDIWSLTETEHAAFRCRYVGFVFQFPSLLPNLTVVDNVAVPALLGRTMEAEVAYARAQIYSSASVSVSAPTPIRARCPGASSAGWSSPAR
jgi:ABC-type lipoprotein export system ATPase subunit